MPRAPPSWNASMSNPSKWFSTCCNWKKWNVFFSTTFFFLMLDTKHSKTCWIKFKHVAYNSAASKKHSLTNLTHQQVTPQYMMKIWGQHKMQYVPRMTLCNPHPWFQSCLQWHQHNNKRHEKNAIQLAIEQFFGAVSNLVSSVHHWQQANLPRTHQQRGRTASNLCNPCQLNVNLWNHIIFGEACKIPDCKMKTTSCCCRFGRLGCKVEWHTKGNAEIKAFQIWYKQMFAILSLLS